MCERMAPRKKTAILLAAAMLSYVAFAAPQPFGRYQTVIDRKPFGPEPVNFNPEAAPGSAASGAGTGEMTEEQRTAEEQQLAASVRVSMINVTPAGAVAVGFTDSSANPAENYYLIVGRSQNGWTVKSADPAAESVTLAKGGVEVTVKLGETVGGKAKGAGGHRAARPMALQSKGGAPAYSPQASGETSGAADGAAGKLGGLARLRKRRAELLAKAQAEAAKKAEADAVAAAERAEEARQRAEREAREAEEREQQREALRQIQEQLRKEREEREAAAARQSADGQEEQSEANVAE